MSEAKDTYTTVEELLSRERPAEPVYCIHPGHCVANAKSFVEGFPGRVLYAVKANDHPDIVRLIHEGGVRHFDCASLPEIETVRAVAGDATCYFMTPVRLRGAARTAREAWGVRHFLVDHPSGVELLAREVDMKSTVVFARMAVSHPSAMINLSTRFGAPPDEIPAIVDAIAASGAEPALAFNVGSSVTSPEAYRHSLEIARGVLVKLDQEIRLLDIGGGFPRAYPGFDVPPLPDYFESIGRDIARLPLAEAGEVLAEPGRALAAPSMSAIVEVCLRKDDRLYLNDGMYGIFWELRFKGHDRFPVRAYRNGKPLNGDARSFSVFGPTCDSMDELPGRVDLPADIRVGDHLEFGAIGAYSVAGRTRFNGFYSDRIVTILDGNPPTHP